MKTRWMLAGDMNQGVEPVRHLLDAPHSFGAPPMGAFWSTGWEAKTSTRQYKSLADHKILRIVSGEMTIAVVNMTWQWGGDKELAQQIAEWADVMLMVECRTKGNDPLPIKDFIGKTHRVRQDLKHGADQAGSCIAVRKDPNLVLRGSTLQQVSPAALGVQSRHLRGVLVQAHGVPTRFGAVHLGLKSTGVQDDGERALQNWVARARRAG